MSAEVEGTIEAGDGRQVTYLARGPADGRAVLYLHGMPSSRLEQRLFPDDALAQAGIRLISFDRPGWGRTDAVPGDRIARSRDALAVADHFGLAQFSLMAVSAGGTYGLTLAASAPERVTRVLLVSAQLPYDDDAAIATMQPDQLALVPVARLGRTAELVAGCEAYRRAMLDDVVGRFWPSLATLSEAERAFVAQPWLSGALIAEIAEGLRISAEGLVDDLLSWPTPLEVDPRSIACPVVAMHGTADDWEPLPNLRRILERMPQAEVRLCPGMNHFGPLLEPAATLALAVAD